MSDIPYVKKGIRALPLFIFAFLALVILEFVPNVFEHLYAYGTYLNTPLDSFGEHGWYIYLLSLPFLALCFSDINHLWPFLICYAILPISICFSYWLWEWLGWCVLGGALFLVCIFVIGLGDDNTELSFMTIGASSIYLIARIILYYVNEELLHPLDIIATCVLYFPPVIWSYKVYFTKDKTGYDAKIFAYSNNVYVIALCLLVIAGAFIFKDNSYFHNLNFAKSKSTQKEINIIYTAKYVCTASTLNVRSYASTKAPSIGKLKKGDIIQVYYINNGFAKIDYNGTSGYVSSKHIASYPY